MSSNVDGTGAAVINLLYCDRKCFPVRRVLASPPKLQLYNGTRASIRRTVYFYNLNPPYDDECVDRQIENKKSGPAQKSRVAREVF